MAVEKITIRGFKSIRVLEAFELKKLNLLIGANGAGKSNFCDLFRFLGAYLRGHLHTFVKLNGRADSFLFNGPKATEEILVHLESPPYQLNLILRALLTNEFTELSHVEPRLLNAQENEGDAGSPSTDHFDTAWNSAFSSSVYHFNDTSKLTGMRRDQPLRDWRELRPDDARNIAAFLYRLRQNYKDRYAEIRYHVRLIAPYFDDFILEPEQSGPAELIRLEWRHKGSSTPWQPYQFSDGTIRFICLAAALLQPNPPRVIVIDEPELGLHPFALGVLASMLRQASGRSQIIVSTQSAQLLDNFEPEEVIVVDRENGASRFRRLEAGPLQNWLQDYSLGQLWQKNVLDGSPVYE